MNRVTKALADTASKVMFRASEVTDVVELGAHFRSIELTGGALEGTTWVVGDKIQVRTDPDGFTTRTYTPLSWDTARGSTRLLAYAHGDGPGSAWVRTVTAGSSCQFFGPRRSLKLDELPGPIFFVGDETSIALVAAWRGRHPDAEPEGEVFEVGDPDACHLALDSIGLSSAQLLPRDRSGHLEQLSATVVDRLSSRPDASLCLTGRAQTIAAIRRDLKAAGLAGRAVRAKAYWDENRSGLD